MALAADRMKATRERRRVRGLRELRLIVPDEARRRRDGCSNGRLWQATWPTSLSRSGVNESDVILAILTTRMLRALTSP
jgi:hypothetical protein